MHSNLHLLVYWQFRFFSSAVWKWTHRVLDVNQICPAVPWWVMLPVMGVASEGRQST